MLENYVLQWKLLINYYNKLMREEDFMKVVLLAGGFGTRISEESHLKPKPMIEVGDMPILWHIMKMYSAQGIREFIVCGGYKVNLIKEYFTDFYVYQSDITVDLQTNTIQIHKKDTEDWLVTVVDTGIYSSAAQRVINAIEYIGEGDFIVTYGDCLSDIDVGKMKQVHDSFQGIATCAITKPHGRNQLIMMDKMGKMVLDTGNNMASIEQKESSWINANTIMFKKDIFKYISAESDLENGLFTLLGDDITIYQHNGFWSAIETKRERLAMNTLWTKGVAPWKLW